MKRISLLALAVAGIVALAQAGTQAQVTAQTPAPTESSNCDQCRQLAASCQNQKSDADKAMCQKMASQCRCSK